MTRTFLDITLTTWTAEEREPKLGAGLPPHMSIILFSGAGRHGWVPFPRSLLPLLDWPELRGLLERARWVATKR
jgi:hypothetical protein